MPRDLPEILRENLARLDHQVRWPRSYRRGAKECIVIFVDCRTNKIVEYEMTQRTKFGLTSDYHGLSNGMEIARL
jgi:hypothetical protein